MFFKKNDKKIDDKSIVAVVSGQVISGKDLSDPIFGEEKLGKTFFIKPAQDISNVVSPANGIIEMLYPTGHAFAIRTKDNLGILVHIGVDTIELNGKYFKTALKQGQEVKAGQSVVNVNFKEIAKLGYDISIMTIIVENPENRTINFTNQENIHSGELITVNN
jgi:glucose-specific phosphotransferase system IIA component